MSVITSVIPRLRCLLTAGLATLALLALVPQAHASSGYLNVTWPGIYPGSASDNNAGCQLCHGNSTQNLNPYGADIATSCGASGTISQRIQAAEGLDSDGQGDSNLVEINANTQPGWTTGTVPVVTRGGCAPAGNDTYQDQGDVDPAAPPVNTPPVANNDAYSTAFETALNIAAPGVLANDTDADGDALTAVQQSDPANGTATLNANGSFTYTPNGGFSGTDSFTYAANDGTENGNTATVTITVAAPGNTPPVAVDDSYNTPFQTQLTVVAPGILGNDTDADGDTLTAVQLTNVSNGTLNLGADGSFTYVPNVGFSGADSFTYQANDGTDNSNTATVTINVGAAPPVNTPPVANNDAYNTAFETALNIAAPGVLANDTDADGDALTAAQQSNPANGTATLNANGSFTYTPNAGFSGPDSFTYLANDGTDNSNIATVTVTVGQAPPVGDCEGINIDNAEWRANGNGSLRVSGTGERDGVFVLSNAFDLAQVIDSTNGRNGRFSFNVGGRNLNPVPCSVRVEQPDLGLCGEAVVANAPADCAPQAPVGGDPIARGDTYATPLAGNSANPKTLVVRASRTSGVLYNDFDTDADGNSIGNAGLTAILVTGPSAGTLSSFDADGSFVYTPGPTLVDNSNDSFTYQAMDADGNLSEVATVNIHIESDQVDFKIMMNYELGMHCTGFEFSYCCVLPPYNSILAQVVKPQSDPTPDNNADFPRLLQGDPNNGLDGLGRETVVRDFTQGGDFQKYYLEYYHDAQPRREGNMPGTFNDQVSTLISDAEANSLLYHNTPYDSALVDTDGSITGVPGKLVRAGDLGTTYNGMSGPVVGDGDFSGAADNYANGWLNHFYIYPNADGNPNLEGENATAGVSLEADKIRLGVNGHVVYPANVGAALQPLGPVSSTPVPFDNVLTFSADTGTVVYTQMKVLENLPIMLTSPRIWEALGLPLTPFEDTINFFGDPGAVDEDTIRPYVAMKARLHEANCDNTGNCTQGLAVVGSNGQPVIGHGTAPIDIPNCERCHSTPAFQPDGVTPNVNSPSYVRGEVTHGPSGLTLEAITELEYDYWLSVYPTLATGTDWYARLKSAAVNMLAMHDYDTGTGFLDNYPATDPLPGRPADDIPQNTRMGHESVICQKCHGDNVIAAVNPLGPDAGFFLPPITEAIHNRHRSESEGGPIAFNDGLGRDGGCQGCHPAHRSDGVMDEYPITLAGNNANANGDNRLNQGGCFVGRDVHSNPLKDVDGAETPAHLNAMGQYLADNVFYNQAGLAGSDADNRGIWCTNCHSQAGQEMWKVENCVDLINNDCDPNANPRAAADMPALAAALGTTLAQLESWADPKDPGVDPDLPLSGAGARLLTGDDTHAIWDPDPGLCNYVAGAFGVIPVDPAHDGNVATVEVNVISAEACSTEGGTGLIDCGVPFPGAPAFHICGSTDGDGDFNVSLLDFCTTQDCVDAAQATLPAGSVAVPVPFSAATDGRDHWLSAGEPHCADCHAAPYVEQSGNINPFPPFNYPRKASLMRYSRGHQDLGCQACHESIHGLYPVTPAVDNTSYAQAAALNHDGSHGPLKCGACHEVGDGDIPTWLNANPGNVYGITDYDSAVTWAHTYTDEADVRESTCQNCHGDFSAGIGVTPDQCPEDDTSECYVGHADSGRTSRLMMDKAEIAQLGHIIGASTNADGTPNNGVQGERNALCSACHGNELGDVECDGEWREHLTRGRVAESVWEEISLDETATTCGW